MLPLLFAIAIAVAAFVIVVAFVFVAVNAALAVIPPAAAAQTTDRQRYLCVLKI